MPIKHQFNKSILHEYDIRGIVGDSLKEEDASALGRAFGTVILRNGGKKICLGFDGWWLIRASNTQNVIVARCEAKDEATLWRIYSSLSEQLLMSGLQPPEIS